jgi:CheY-like chemotaxis protein
MTPVLVVEDEDDIRQAVRWALEDAGYVVDEAPDGRPALDRLRASRQGTVVVLDLQMPGLDGMQVLQAVAADAALGRRHAFVVATAMDHRTLPLAFALLLTDLQVEVIAKPFDLDALLAAVRRAEGRLG